ncbi:hypothetical protein CDAR_10301 [Caerostris darwini]|uniref:Uncharacterized protein n=1 Tax=Caerostris darwini TaxID=1538125 RepID=A0AAV4VKT8_9ARAC|nr:hypothetical protein CDAR_10301 [Caerostris darwini]
MWVHSRPKGKTAFCFHRIPISPQQSWKVWKWIGSLGSTFECLSRVSISECNSKEIALFDIQILTVHFVVMEYEAIDANVNHVTISVNCRDESIGLKCGFIRARKGRPLFAFTEFQSRCSSRGRCGNGSEISVARLGAFRGYQSLSVIRKKLLCSTSKS